MQDYELEGKNAFTSHKTYFGAICGCCNALYAMQTTPLPKDTCRQIDMRCRSFLWDTGFDLSSLLPLLSERRTRAAKQGSSTKCCFVSSPTLVLLLQTPVLQASDSVIFSEPAPPSTVQRGRAEA
ncbi:hypothetical protein K1719_027910 [Acacia pycnantha]|nr:hypothetical protein K1719_027910 [Acacia pycnantha]